jgi:tetratricopeptide (TPR) repeat protein
LSLKRLFPGLRFTDCGGINTQLFKAKESRVMVTEPKQEQQIEPEKGSEEATKTEKQQLLALFRQHVQPVLIGLGIALAILLAYGSYKNYKQSTVMRASQMLMSAQSIEQIQQVISQYPSTPSAPIAMLTLASEYFRSGQYDLAQVTYAQFQQKFPKHPMAVAADIGKAQCLEASGQLDQALAAFEVFEKTNPGHFLSASAIFGKARCLTQLGRYTEAKAVYEDYMVSNPKSGWIPLADAAMLFVDKELRAWQRKQNSPTVETVNPANPEVPAATAVPLTLSPMVPSEATSSR